MWLTKHSYVEQTLEDNKLFDAKGLLEKNPSYQGRLKFWTNELCAEKPETFDIVLAVGRLPFHLVDPTTDFNTARRRWDSPLRLVALPAHCPASHLLLARLPRFPHKIRLRALPTVPLHRLCRRHNRQSASTLRSHNNAVPKTGRPSQRPSRRTHR
jgi:hypothetical protein